MKKTFYCMSLAALLLSTATVVWGNAETSDSPQETNKKAVTDPRSNSVSHEKMTFFADIVEKDIVDGTADFDSPNKNGAGEDDFEKDDPGNDSSPNNKIVRSFDTITYPLKMTVNNEDSGILNNIKVKITGTLKNGVTAGHVNATFAENGKVDTENNRVTYEQQYTIPSSGNAVTLPVLVNVLGADNGLDLTPEFKVQVLSVDGEDISDKGLVDTINTIAPRKTSSKVSVSPKISSGTAKFASQTIISKEAYETEDRTVPLGVELMVTPLPEKKDVKGSAFPKGDLKMDLSMDGYIVWDDDETEIPLDFKKKDQAPLLIDHHNYVVSSGSKDMVSKNENTYSKTQDIRYNQVQFNDTRNYWAGSKMTDKPSYNELSSIWDSGKYRVSGYDLSQKVEIDVTDYVIGATFPIRRADGYTGRTVYNSSKEKPFTNQNFDVMVADDYAHNSPLNPESKDNTIYYNANLTYEEDGEVKTAKTQFSIRNEVPGIEGALSANFKNPETLLPFGKYRQSNPIDPYGDGQVVSGTRVWLSAGGNFGDTIVPGGYQLLQKWNTDAFQMTAADFNDNVKLLDKAVVLGNINQTVKDKGYWFGISKQADSNSLDRLAEGKITDYEWYTKDQLEESQYSKISAVLQDYNVPVAKTWRFSGNGNYGLFMTTVTERPGSKTDQETPNVYVAEIDIFRDKERKPFDPTDPAVSLDEPSRFSITDKYAVHHETIYDENNQLSSLQAPVNLDTKFDTLGIIEVKVDNTLTSEKEHYHSTDTVKWTIKDNSFIASENYHDTDEIKWTVNLPSGVSYIRNTGTYGDEANEPEVFTNEDGSQTLVWKITAVSTVEETALLEDIQFETQFDEYLINYVNNTASLTARSVISTAKDTRSEELRTSEHTIEVTAIGRLGLYETVEPTVEDIDQEYQLTMHPYTAIKDEPKIRGLVLKPRSGGTLHSHFFGKTTVKAIETANLPEGQSVNFYVSKQFTDEFDPNKIDVSGSDWTPYKEGMDLTEVNAIWYEFQSVTKPGDTPEIKVTFANQGNHYGDRYIHHSFQNSGSNYEQEIHSNTVEHKVVGRRLSGFVWLDADKDGEKQAGEAPISAVPVYLYKQTDAGAQLVTENLRGESLTMQTLADGSYAFDYLPEGKYFVGFDKTSEPLKGTEVTLFNIGEEAVNSKVDLDHQQGQPDHWTTIDSQQFPVTAEMTQDLVEQKHMNLGVYKKENSGTPGGEDPDPEKPDPEESTTDESNSSSDTDESSDPTNSSDLIESSDPDETSVPSEPSSSGESSDTDESSDPTNSSDLIESSDPDETSVPSEPSSSDESSDTDESSDPTNSSDLIESSDPDETSVPSEPSSSGESSDTDESSDPTSSSDLIESSDPDETSVPSEPSSSGESSDPDETSVPSEPSSSGESSDLTSSSEPTSLTQTSGSSSSNKNYAGAVTRPTASANGSKKSLSQTRTTKASGTSYPKTGAKNSLYLLISGGSLICFAVWQLLRRRS